MSIPFANFDQSSPLSTSPHDPMLSLASNCIRDAYGPTVQMVADALMFRGGGGGGGGNGNNSEACSWTDLIRTLRQKTPQKHYSQERIRLLGPKVSSRLQNQSLQLAPLRAALLVLVQHSIVKVTTITTTTIKSNKTKVVYLYRLDRKRARLLPRYPRYVEYAKRALDNTAATLVEELLVQGRLRTVDAIQKAFEQLQDQQQQQQQQQESAVAATAAVAEITTSSSSTADKETNNHQRVAPLQALLESFKRLTAGGFLEQVPKIQSEDDLDEEEENEFEFEQQQQQEPPKKKPKLQEEDGQQLNNKNDDQKSLLEKEDPTIVALLEGNSYKHILPRNAVWRVNIHMFHDNLRAFVLGRLVSERYGHKVQSAGSMVTAALKYLAHRKYAGKYSTTTRNCNNNKSGDGVEDNNTFDAASIVRYLPKPVVQLLEKRRGASGTTTTTGSSSSSSGNSVVAQVARSFQQLASYQLPSCVLEVEVGAKPEDSKFQINILRLVQYAQSRITNQMITDHHGEVAARIVTILTQNGHLESDSLAEAAMVPAKDTREILHRLYRTKYISLFTLNTSRQHNPSNMIYLWRVVGSHIIQTAKDNVCTALLNLRLRRQHQVEIGKTWIERAQEAGDMDENDHEADKMNHRKFCLGLERLYYSCLQLDETLMVLEDF